MEPLNICQKAIPIGIENFETMIKGDYYYIDKTLLIKDLIDHKGYVNLFTRPRRFGKSLNMSMLQYYFENTKKEKAPLFDHLKISTCSEKYLHHQNAYPVIMMSLKGVEGESFEGAMTKLIDEISREYDRHGFLLKHLNGEKKIYFQNQIDKVVEKDTKGENVYHNFGNSLKFLSDILERYYQKKVIIIIDEYDVPLEKAYFNGYYQQMVNFLRSYFNAALKTNDSLDFAIITGCLRASKESIFTGINNFHVLNITSDAYGEYFGFTESEVSKALQDFNQQSRYDEAKHWYNGYLFGKTTVYNPWSFLNYLFDVTVGKKEYPVGHWANSSSNSIVRELIDEADDEIRLEIENLMNTGTITTPIKEDMVYAEIKNSPQNIWNFLFFTGYLKKVAEYFDGQHIYYKLSLPNKEVAGIYETHIMAWLNDSVQKTDLQDLFKALLESDSESFQEILSEFLMDSISFNDYAENFYHGFLTATLRPMKRYTVKSNREIGNGRGDLFIRPVNILKPAIIIEVKVAKDIDHMNALSEIALLQIKEKNYEDELRREGYRKFIHYGIVFFKKTCLVVKG